MDVLVIGATGFVGGGVARHLRDHDHHVRGLARSEVSADTLRAAGVEPVGGSFEAGWDEVLAVAGRVDAVVHAAQAAPEVELAMVASLLERLSGTGRTFVFTSGSGVLLQRTEGAWSPDNYAEDDPFPVEPLATTREAVEDLVRAAAGRGVRSVVVRPGTVWGPGDHGHVASVYGSVARTGAACFVGEGLNTYSHVHIDDVARLFAAALERGSAGALHHATAGEVPSRWIAERVAADLGVQTRSITPDEAVDVWGGFEALSVSASSRLRDPRSRTELGWVPHRSDLLSSIGEPRLRDLARHP